jgi:hypothetical protein
MKSGLFSAGDLDDPNQVEFAGEIRANAQRILAMLLRVCGPQQVRFCPTGKSVQL